MQKTCIAVCGPTASGKTALSLTLAEYFSTSILSFDSRQCYKELNLGVAKPSPEELSRIKHFFINSHHISDLVTAALFERYGSECLENIFIDNDIAILVGGTGLYLKALLEGLDDIPPTHPSFRKQVNDLYENKGLPALQEALHELDPFYFSTTDIQNPRRLMRALEVCLQTGKAYSSFVTRSRKETNFNTILIAPDIPRQELYERINTRVIEMVKAGLEAETASLTGFRDLPSLQTVGYSEWFEYFDGKITREEAIREIMKNTRNYAKRQLTWFRKQNGIHWIPPGTDIIQFTQNLLKLNS